ncbi:3-phosphoshikimate 1-carboxyvinyltransferase [Haematococcus lacustris]|uniref:3-phosphoshikimate 1-carboxyvinyltransferase n=1 Tax=Haematococcus lacustris TaxID=44745 RepID=A0A699YI23_HAELA|nr:3-phosphoshikimate 1-carboxyvinyltransferase [Haematococcus lacustris]
MRLCGAQEKVLERYFKMLEEEAAMVSQQRWGTRKQLVVFFGNAGIGTWGGWGAKAVLQACRKVVERANSGRPTDRLPGKVVTVDEFRTSRFSSAMNSPQPCEAGLDRSKLNRPEGWKPQPAEEQLVLQPISTISGTVKLPGSKSLSNRILLLAALAEGTTVVKNLLVRGFLMPFGLTDSDDIRYMVGALKALGVQLEERWDRGEMLVQVQLSGSVSSQYLTALLMAAPLATGTEGIEVIIKDELVSQPYVDMTVKIMERFGVVVNKLDGLQHMHIPPNQTYKSPGKSHATAETEGAGREAYVEGDASSASYFLAGATITGGTVVVEGCGSESLQGDVRFAKVMEMLGAEVEWSPYSIKITGPTAFGRPIQAIDHDCNDIPDAAMTLAVAALFANGTTAIRNVYNWRVKETERMVAVVSELRKLGAQVEEGRDYCVITPPAQIKSTDIDTYDDHRMAMAFSLAACGGVPITINDPGCTRKTFPTYFSVLESVVQH